MYVYTLEPFFSLEQLFQVVARYYSYAVDESTKERGAFPI